MAGFQGIPIGTIGTQPGSTNFSPYISMRQAQIEAELAQARMAQEGNQFQQQMVRRTVESAIQQKLADRDFGFKVQEFQHGQSMDIENAALRGEAAKEQSRIADKDMELREREIANRERDTTLDDEFRREQTRKAEDKKKLDDAALKNTTARAGQAEERIAEVMDKYGFTPEQAASYAREYARDAFKGDAVAAKEFVDAATNAIAERQKRKDFEEERDFRRKMKDADLAVAKEKVEIARESAAAREEKNKADERARKLETVRKALQAKWGPIAKTANQNIQMADLKSPKLQEQLVAAQQRGDMAEVARINGSISTWMNTRAQAEAKLKQADEEWAAAQAKIE